MIKIILLAISAVLAVLGLCEVLHTVRLLILAPKQPPEAITVIKLSGEESLRQLHYAGAALSWSEAVAGGKRVAVCDEPENELSEEYLAAAAQYDILLCSTKQLMRFFEATERE